MSDDLTVEQELERALDMLDVVADMLGVPWRDSDGEVLSVEEYRRCMEAREAAASPLSDWMALAERGQR